MQTSDCFSPGFVLRPHGIKGSILLGLKVEDSKAYAELGALFIEIRHNLVPYIIEEISIKGNKAYVKLEGVDTPEQAEELKNKQIWLPLDAMPESDRVSPERLIGFEVHDKNVGPIGTLEEVGGSKMQKVLSIQHPSGNEILLPYTPEFLTEVNIDEAIIYVTCPDGLIDLYLNPNDINDEEE